VLFGVKASTATSLHASTKVGTPADANERKMRRANIESVLRRQLVRCEGRYAVSLVGRTVSLLFSNWREHM